jgi:hypothetical protein
MFQAKKVSFDAYSGQSIALCGDHYLRSRTFSA